MKYAFTTEELNKVERLSKEIEKLKRLCNVQSKKVCADASDSEIGKWGLMAEYAVVSSCGQNINMDLYQDHGDFGIDTIIKGKTLDVKFNGYRNGYLYFISPKHFVADIGCLCVPGDDEYEIEMVGIINRKIFLENSTQK